MQTLEEYKSFLYSRYKELEAEDFKGVEPRIIPVVKSFHDKLDVIPVWSCSGHTREEKQKRADIISEKKGIEKREIKNGNFSSYVVLVTKNGAKENHVKNYFDNFCNLYPKEGVIKDINYYLTYNEFFLSRMNDQEKHYKAIKLEFKYFSSVGDTDADELVKVVTIGKMWDLFFEYCELRNKAIRYRRKIKQEYLDSLKIKIKRLCFKENENV